MPLVENKKYWYLIVLFFLFIFIVNITIKFQEFEDFKSLKVYEFDGYIENIYFKDQYNILKIDCNDFTIFTSINKKIKVDQLNNVSGYLLTSKISFLQYLKGMYVQSFGLNIEKVHSQKHIIKENIVVQHTENDLAQLYNALFMAIPIDQVLRDQCAILGISHLIALSGFHLGLLSSICFFLLYYPYSFLQQRYFPYRNRKIDLLVIVSIIMFGYLYFTNFVPSLLRAFVMSVVGVYFLQANIKLLSYETLLFIVLLILSLFPTLLFSLSFWFSVCGVFYIYLFLQYFKNIPKVGQLILFNFWIYLVINAVVHYFFDITSLMQLFSPILSILFVVFYPLNLFLHLIQEGGLLDSVVGVLFQNSFESYNFITPLWFFIFYVAISFGAIFHKYGFYLLNIAMIGFNGYVYLLL